MHNRHRFRATIEDLKDILANETRVLEIIRTDLTEIKTKYPSPRKTEISVDYGNIAAHIPLIPNNLPKTNTAPKNNTKLRRLTMIAAIKFCSIDCR